MDTKICLDTDVSIEILKNTDKGNNFVASISNRDVLISSISVFELYLRETNIFAVERLVAKADVLEFSDLCAKKAAEVFKELKKRGITVPFRDLFIASTAIVNGCTLATLNVKDFKNIKDLKLLEF